MLRTDRVYQSQFNYPWSPQRNSLSFFLTTQLKYIGRDTYVSYENGGLMQSTRKVEAPSMSSSFGRRKFHFVPKPGYFSPPVTYKSDGSGRDFYIKCNEGGMKRVDYSPDTRVNFAKSLRNHERIRTMSTVYGSFDRDFFLEGQLKLPEIERKKVQKLKQDQGVLVQKLSTPKHVRTVSLTNYRSSEGKLRPSLYQGASKLRMVRRGDSSFYIMALDQSTSSRISA
eukprot:TRINITY_DN788_c0_g1_i9.p1 TRINITY_DN788_c0_g1~~TRINITY_DN788_c0_g1_i9.p1  ORF type:complete len:226 (-),score=10.89 TRINITY_DN788_c0_g1_i9:458-1135(-)